MEQKHYLDKGSNCIVAEFTGAFPTTDPAIDQFYLYVAGLFNTYGTHKMLIDYRQMVYEQSATQIVKSYERVQKFELNNEQYVVAIVFDLASESFQRYRMFLAEWDTKLFFGDIKVDYKVFGDMDEALGWMKSVE